MSGFAVITVGAGRPTSEPDFARVAAALSSRGDRTETWRAEDASMAAVHFDWEATDNTSSDSMLVHDGSISVAADATLYYREDLISALKGAGQLPTGITPAHLIGAAYRAWGAECPLHLEGDYAFVVRDHARRRTFATRDFMGRRPLYYAQFDGSLLIASSVAAVLAHPRCSRDLDLVALAEIAGVSLAGSDRTPYSAVSALPAATSLVCDDRQGVATRRYWRPRIEDGADPEPFEAAADRLESLLSAAVLERRARSGPTVLWLSGGYDSSVLFGVGNAALDRMGRPRLQPVSFSHPVGDAGREDERIEEITRFWRASPTWFSIQDVPLLGDAEANAAGSDVPFQHAFGNWIRALLGATRDQGSHVALNGDGGDQLFAVSGVFLRDLFAQGRWGEMWREWRALGGRNPRSLWGFIVRPELGARLREGAGRSRPALTLPVWIRPELVREHELDRRHADVDAEMSASGAGRAAAETALAITNALAARVACAQSFLGLERSVELRVPLLDRRIVEFAVRRPRSERASQGAVKHLLRQAGRNRLPAAVLEARSGRKTGVLTDYFRRSFRADPEGIVTDAFERSRLADLGIVDRAELQKAWRGFKEQGRGSGGHLMSALQTELWLRTRDR